MDIERATKVKATMLLAVQLFSECHDELKDFSDYNQRLKFTAKQFEKELSKKLIKEVDLVYVEDDGVIANEILSDIESYVGNLMESIKCS